MESIRYKTSGTCGSDTRFFVAQGIDIMKYVYIRILFIGFTVTGAQKKVQRGLNIPEKG